MPDTVANANASTVDLGYGVSYMMADDARTFFHVSSKRKCGKTDSKRFMTAIKKALEDIQALFPAEDAKQEAKNLEVEKKNADALASDI